MKKLIPFIPVIGIFIVIYLRIIKGEETSIENNALIFFSSAFIQAISIVLLFNLIP